MLSVSVDFNQTRKGHILIFRVVKIRVKILPPGAAGTKSFILFSHHETKGFAVRFLRTWCCRACEIKIPQTASDYVFGMTGASKSVAGAQSPSEARRLTAAPRGLYEAYGASEAIFTLENAASAPLTDHEDRNPSLGTEHVLFPRADTSPD